MGRLDDAAKHKVVELRKAGLSFRKIKAVLELENIKVSAQAIYLFLRELHGRPPGRVRPEEAAGGVATSQSMAVSGGGGGGTTTVGARREGWSNVQLQNLLREASHHASLAAASEFAKQSAAGPEAGAQPSGSGDAAATAGVSRAKETQDRSKDENDIQIISVTSLAQNCQQRSAQSAGAAGTTLGAFMRRRVTPSPATSPMLAARKRLLDKALSHRTKSFQQMASLLRRDQSGVPGTDLRSAMARQPETYDLTTETAPIGGAGTTRRFLQQRPGLSVRPPHPMPRVGVRLPTRAAPTLTSQTAGGSVVRLQTPGGQGPVRRDGVPSPQQAAQEAGGRGGGASVLQDQIQALGSEVRSLGLAVRMLVEQQSRLEREQGQQTQIQRQILATLQSLAPRPAQCTSLAQHQHQHNKTPSPSSLPSASAPASFSQPTFTYSQSAYAQCSQAQPTFSSIDGLESVESFKLPGLSPTAMNGFQQCSNTESLPLTHTPTQQAYPATYAQQHNQTLIPPYTQSFAPSFTQSHTQSYRGTENKALDYPSSCPAGPLQDCSSSQTAPEDPQLNIIKVEVALPGP